MRKIVRLPFLFATFACLLALAACGGSPSTGGDSPSTGGDSTGGSTEITISAEGTDLKFDKQSITVQTGDQVSITFDNHSAMPHSFVIEGPVDVAIPEDHTAGLNGGESGTISFTAPEPGTYEFYGAVPGHKQGGMVGTLEVTP